MTGYSACLCVTLIGLLVVISHSSSSLARDLWKSQSDGQNRETVLRLNSSLKAATLLSTPPYNNAESSQGWNGTAILRLRLEPSFETGSWKFDAAYDNQFSYTSEATSSSGLALPLATQVPFRLWPISYTTQFGSFTDTQQLDRAFISFKHDRLDIALGRHALGWGRGTLFNAIDIFAPFTPLQIDQEWRHGVDALNVDYRLTDTISAQVVLVGGPSWSDSALGGRLRGYFGTVDVELIVAKRALDVVYGASSSMPISDVEMHGELAFFQTPGDSPSEGIFGIPWLVPKAVLGVSNNFKIGSGLSASLEYHYSGFGASSSSQLQTLLSNPAFMARLTQGCTQIIGAQTLGLNLSYAANERWNLTYSHLQSLIDSSGVLSASASFDIAENTSFLGNLLFAYGAPSLNDVVQSQYGSITPTLILQIRFYD